MSIDKKVIAVLLAAGKSKRFKKGFKQFKKIEGKNLFEYSLEKFLSVKEVEKIFFVVPKDFKTISIKNARVEIISGGRRRQDSLFNALSKIKENCDVVIVHDSARPFVTKRDIKNVIRETIKNGASICGMKVYDTIKLTERDFVKRTLPREKLFRAATPQGFRGEFLEKVKKLLKSKSKFTDEASVFEKLKIPVKIVVCENENFKITTEKEFKIAKVLLGGAGEKKSCK